MTPTKPIAGSALICAAILSFAASILRAQAPSGLLTPVEEKRFAEGEAIYKGLCIGCHMANGRGQEKVAPSLVDSRYVVSPDPGSAIRIVVGGKEGATGLMPPLGVVLTDEQIAAALTYVRRSWGHAAPAVDPAAVQRIREQTKDRTRPWTEAELSEGRTGGTRHATPRADAARLSRPTPTVAAGGA
jgi:mono/diheme cytochrome c family protein